MTPEPTTSTFILSQMYGWIKSVRDEDEMQEDIKPQEDVELGDDREEDLEDE